MLNVQAFRREVLGLKLYTCITFTVPMPLIGNEIQYITVEPVFSGLTFAIY